MAAFIFVAVMVGLFAILMGHYGYYPKAVKGRKTKTLDAPKVNLSPVAKELVKDYDRLPDENKPFPDITTLVASLDKATEHNAVARDRHFDRNWLANIERQNGSYLFSWKGDRYGVCNGNHNNRHCPFKGYWVLHEAIDEVTKTLAEKAKAIAISEAKPDLEMLDELMNRLREEAEINRSFTKSFKELS